MANCYIGYYCFWGILFPVNSFFLRCERANKKTYFRDRFLGREFFFFFHNRFLGRENEASDTLLFDITIAPHTNGKVRKAADHCGWEKNKFNYPHSRVVIKKFYFLSSNKQS